MTNGQITKKILRACKSKTGDDLKAAVTGLLRSFPLSSYKLVYEEDQAKVSAEAWAILMTACVATDKRKLESQHQFMKSMDASYDTNPGLFPRSFGRFVGEDED